MKKNRMLRLASALLILTLLTTSVIGGTFAKYVSEGSVSDTARVAKWGVEIKTSGTLYSDAYAKKGETDGNTPAVRPTTAETSFGNISVSASTANDNIVAPGTKSYEEGLSFALAGTPEVAVTVKATIEAEDIFLAKGTYGILEKATVTDQHGLDKLIKDHTDTDNTINVFSATTSSGTTTYARLASNNAVYAADTEYYILTDEITLDNDYFPVEYKLEGSTNNTEAGKSKTASGIADLVAKAIKSDASADTDSDKKSASNNVYKTKYSGTSVNANFPANTNLGTAGPKFKDEKLTWDWSYQTGADDTAKAKIDHADTLLGDMIAARGATGDSAPTYKIVDISTPTGGTETVTVLTFSTDDDYTVKKGDTVVANLRTKFDIKLTVEQVD